MEYSDYQNDIFEFIKNGTGNAVVEAVAGSGKTSTILQALNYIDNTKRVIFVAFNKHIADELAEKVPFGFEARTCHSVGFQILRKNMGKLSVKNNKVANVIKYNVMTDKERKEKWKQVRPICRIISLMKAMNVKSWSNNEAINIADNHDIELPDDLNLGKLAWDKMIAVRHRIDFDDMIWLPVFENLTFPKYDWVFVDEAQDLSPVQIEFVSRLTSGRIVAVGDSHQAIYGFRGADTMAMKRLRERFNATELPLSICYRCPKSVVNEAKTLVPHIKSWDDQEDGTVEDVHDLSDLQDGDYVLCRVTKDLVKECMNQIRLGKKAIVKGRDIAEGLENLISNLCSERDTIEVFLERLLTWEEQSIAKTKNELKQINIQDKAATLRVLVGDSQNVAGLIQRIGTIFSDTLNGIVFSTIHKAKGLEAPNIYILRPDLLPHPLCKRDWQKDQEKNLKYVAITRSQCRLFYVKDKDAK